MTILSLPNILNAGFDQIYNLYSPVVYQSGDIIDTYVYRIGLIGRDYSRDCRWSGQIGDRSILDLVFQQN